MTSARKAPAMERMKVTMLPLPRETRLLVMAGRDEGPTAASHPRAAATLLEGLSPCHPQALSVVLCASSAGSSSAMRRFDDLGFGVKTVHYDVEVAFREPHRGGRRLQGFDHFGDLRQRGLVAVAS
jgi:hypothetical protein